MVMRKSIIMGSVMLLVMPVLKILMLVILMAMFVMIR